MKPQQAQIDTFLREFSQLESVPFSVREAFFIRLKAKEGVSPADIAEVQQIISTYADMNDRKLKHLEQKWRAVGNSLNIENQPKFSLKERIVNFTKKVMLEKVERFKSFYQKAQKIELKKVETAEDLENVAEIARLEAAL